MKTPIQHDQDDPHVKILDWNELWHLKDFPMPYEVFAYNRVFYCTVERKKEVKPNDVLHVHRSAFSAFIRTCRDALNWAVGKYRNNRADSLKH